MPLLKRIAAIGHGKAKKIGMKDEEEDEKKKKP